MIGPGSRIGVYEVTARIGMGGMGVVYRAKDTSLGREVAIKVLPDAFVSHPERTARFKREATTLGALNHPNIASIYGLQESDGVLALVLEFVEGPTLADRLAAGGLPIHQALPIARQIADALEAAHDRTPFSLSDVTVRENNLTFMLAGHGSRSSRRSPETMKSTSPRFPKADAGGYRAVGEPCRNGRPTGKSCTL